MKLKLYRQDCRDAMAAMPEASVDAIVTDPPYGIDFMGRGWDHGVPGRTFWSAALRVAKPGAFMFAFGGTRLFHRMTCAIEDAGWEIRDVASWMYGSGFPKSLDVSKAIDKAAGVERAASGAAYSVPNAKAVNPHFVAIDRTRVGVEPETQYQPTAPATPLAQQFDGYGSALKPAWEPVVVAMKPLDGTFAENAARHGLAGLNIDAGRVGTEKTITRHTRKAHNTGAGWHPEATGEKTENAGRWPANVALDEEAAAELDSSANKTTSRRGVLTSKPGDVYGSGAGLPSHSGVYGFNDSGGPSRFFYSAKAGKRDREYVDKDGVLQQSDHPTVKPVELMRWLVRMATPPRSNTVILDPFTGSGSTGVACALEGVGRFVGCEKVPHFADIAEARIRAAIEGQE
tara:strand:+ start:15902 stop:17104 length:1203 start_codon:yes stop_codon:yes gene_type:complete